MHPRLTRIAIPFTALFISLAVVLGAFAQQNNIPPANTPCSPFGNTAPAGQQNPTTLEPSLPIWCYTQPSPVGPTRQSGANDWVDTFDQDGAAIQRLDNGDYDYQRFDFNSEGRIKVGQFVNVNHWMPDIADTSPFSLSGGTILSPNRSFHSEGGTLVFETDAAAGSDAAGGADLFYEIDLSGARPTGITVDPLYGYGVFGGRGAVGCRLERASDGGHIVCAMYDASTRDAGGTDVLGGPSGDPGRPWETQGDHMNGLGSFVGGYPQYPIAGTSMHSSDVWRQCAANELDLHCRDRFRFEFTTSSIHIFANGYPIFALDGLHGAGAIPQAWLDSAFLYDTSWINSGQHYAARWHWDSIMVNRHNADGTFHSPDAYSSFCLGQPNNTCADPFLPGATATPTSVVGLPTATSTPVPAATATRTPLPAATQTPTRTPTPTVTCQVNVRLNGVEKGWKPC